MEYEQEQVEGILAWNAFNAEPDEEDNDEDGLTLRDLLPPDRAFDFMAVCLSVAEQDVIRAEECYNSWALAEVYRWLAVKVANAHIARDREKRKEELRKQRRR